MANLYSSDKKLLGELLRDTLEIPDFQRNYSWDTSLVEIFWNDLIAFSERYPADTLNEQEYFIGPVVLVAQPGQSKKVLDGQQRLATATILLSVACYFLKQLGTTAAATRVQENFIAGFDDYRRSHTYHLTLNQYDREFYRREVQEPRDSAGYIEPDPTLESHRLIRGARAYFLQQFGRKQADFGANTAAFSAWIIRINKVVTDHLSVVHVSSDNEDNAALVFETLNDRGIGLSAPDLLRNLLLSRAQPAQREGVIDYWRSVLQMEGKASVEDFLRHYWLSRNGDVKTRSLYREIKSEIISANLDPLVFSRDLQTESDIYEKIVNGEDEDSDLKSSLEAIISLGAKSAWPLILSVYAVGDLNQKRTLLRMIVSLYVRYSVIGGLENNKIESLAFALARDLRNGENIASIQQRIRALAPTDVVFEERFRIAKVTKSAHSKYLLKKLEETIHAGTGETLLPAIASMNLEHIFPQNPAGPRLPHHEDMIDRLGNHTLLLTRINRALKNAPFVEKVATYTGSELHITNELAQHQTWDEAAIIERQNRFAALASNIWSLA